MRPRLFVVVLQSAAASQQLTACLPSSLGHVSPSSLKLRFVPGVGRAKLALIAGAMPSHNRLRSAVHQEGEDSGAVEGTRARMSTSESSSARRTGLFLFVLEREADRASDEERDSLSLGADSDGVRDRVAGLDAEWSGDESVEAPRLSGDRRVDM